MDHLQLNTECYEDPKMNKKLKFFGKCQNRTKIAWNLSGMIVMCYF